MEGERNNKRRKGWMIDGERNDREAEEGRDGL